MANVVISDNLKRTKVFLGDPNDGQAKAISKKINATEIRDDKRTEQDKEEEAGQEGKE